MIASTSAIGGVKKWTMTADTNSRFAAAEMRDIAAIRYADREYGDFDEIDLVIKI